VKKIFNNDKPKFMQTNFFQLLTETAPNLDWNIRITKMDDGQVIVLVIPFNDHVKDSAKHTIQPIVLKPESIEELNEKFFEAIQAPVKKISTLFANMEAHEKSMEEARKQSQMEKDARDKEEKEKKEKKNKYEGMMKKVAELEKAEKWGEAIGAMPNPKEFEPWAEEINKKLEELRAKSAALSLF
jgi:PRTRC genetic system protein E